MTRFCRWCSSIVSLCIIISAVASAAEVQPDPLEGKPESPAKTWTNPKFQAPGDMIPAGAFGPHFAVGRNKELKDSRNIWSVKDGKSIGMIPGKWEVDKPFALAPSGKFFVGGRGNFNADKIAVFLVQTGKPFAEFKNPGKVDNLYFLADDRLAAVSPDAINVYDVAAKKIVGRVNLPKSGPFGNRLILSPNGRLIVLLNKNVISVYDTAGQELSAFGVPKLDNFFGGDAVNAAFHADGKTLAVTLESFGKHGYMLVDLTRGEIKGPYEIKDVKQPDRIIEWSYDSQVLLIGGQFVVDPDSGKTLWQFPDPPAHAPRNARVMGRVMSSTYGVYFYDTGSGTADAKTIIQDVEKIAVLRKEAQGDVKTAIAASVSVDSGPAPTSTDSVLPKLIATSLAGVKRVDPPGKTAPWQVKVDAPTTLPKINTAPMTINQPAREIGSIIVSPTASRAFVEVQHSEHRGLAVHARSKSVSVFNLSDGLADKKIAIGFPGRFFGASADAKRILTTDPEVGDRLDILTVENAEVIASMKPYAQDLNSRRVMMAAFVGDTKLLTSNGARIVLWNVPTCKPLIQYLAKPHLAELSPNGKYLGVVEFDNVLMLDANNLSVAGKLPMPADPQVGRHDIRAAIFDADSSIFAVCYGVTYLDGSTGAYIATWDLTTGKLGTCATPRNIQFTGRESATIEFFGKDYCLVNNMHLLSMKRNEVIWTFASGFDGKHARSYDGRHWYTVHKELGKDETVLASADIYDSKLFDWLKTIDAAPRTLLKAGMSISIQVQVGGDKQESIQKSIEGMFTGHGFKIDGGAPNVLSVSSSEAATGMTKVFRNLDARFGGGGGKGELTVNVTEAKCLAQLTIDGRQVWESTAKFNNAGSFFELYNPGETLEEHLTKGMRANVARWASSLRPPRLVVETPEGLMGLPGHGEFTGKGLELTPPFLTVGKKE